MDTATNDILKKWNLSHYIERFQAERIDIATMLLLEKDDIKLMFPKIGDRVRFETCLAMLKCDQPKEDNSTSNFLENLDLSIYNLEVPQIAGGSEASSTPSTQNIVRSGGLSTQIDGEASSGQSTQRNLDDDDVIVKPLNSSVGEGDTRNNLVSTILNSSIEGRQILEIGRKTGALPSDVRGRLCKLLMEKLITAENPVLQSDSQLLSLSNDIGRIFKKESPPLYYTPYVPADAYQAKRNTSGWLVTARRARRQHLVSLGLIEKPSSRSRSKSCSTPDRPSHPGIDLTELKEDDVENVASFLEQLSSPSAGPWQEVSDLWRKTVRARLRYLYFEEGTLQEYFNKYPLLKSSDGWRLLTYDYEALFPDKSRGLDAFEASSETILKAAQQKRNTTKDKFLRKKITDTLEICDDAKPETKLTAAILLLGCLFNIPPARLGPRKTGKHRERRYWTDL